MNRVIKKILSVMLTLAMVLTLIPAMQFTPASAAETTIEAKGTYEFDLSDYKADIDLTQPVTITIKMTGSGYFNGAIAGNFADGEWDSSNGFEGSNSVTAKATVTTPDGHIWLQNWSDVDITIASITVTQGEGSGDTPVTPGGSTGSDTEAKTLEAKGTYEFDLADVNAGVDLSQPVTITIKMTGSGYFNGAIAGNFADGEWDSSNGFEGSNSVTAKATVTTPDGHIWLQNWSDVDITIASITVTQGEGSGDTPVTPGGSTGSDTEAKTLEAKGTYEFDLADVNAGVDLSQPVTITIKMTGSGYFNGAIAGNFADGEWDSSNGFEGSNSVTAKATVTTPDGHIWLQNWSDVDITIASITVTQGEGSGDTPVDPENPTKPGGSTGSDTEAKTLEAKGTYEFDLADVNAGIDLSQPVTITIKMTGSGYFNGAIAGNFADGEWDSSNGFEGSNSVTAKATVTTPDGHIWLQNWSDVDITIASITVTQGGTSVDPEDPTDETPTQPTAPVTSLATLSQTNSEFKIALAKYNAKYTPGTEITIKVNFYAAGDDWFNGCLGTNVAPSGSWEQKDWANNGHYAVAEWTLKPAYDEMVIKLFNSGDNVKEVKITSIEIIINGQSGGVITKEPTTEPSTTTQKPSTQATVVNKVKLNKGKVKSASKKKASNKIKITLKKIKNAKKYQVQISKTKKFKKVLVTKSVKKVTFTLKSKKIKNQKVLFVRFRAVNGKVKGKWSTPKKVKIKK